MPRWNYTARDYVLDTLANLPPDDQCTKWPYHTTNAGIGSVSHNGKEMTARVFAYHQAYGIPEDRGKVYLTCGTSHCFRPSHLKRIPHCYEYVVKTLANLPEGDDCIDWPFALRDDGYGELHLPKALGFTRRVITPYQLAYILTYGAIEEGQCVLHRCDRPSCFRPSHLFSGTQLDNIADMISKGRNKPFVLRGTDANGKRFDDETIRAIRAAYDSAAFTKVAISKQFFVSATHLDRILKRQSRRNA